MESPPKSIDWSRLEVELDGSLELDDVSRMAYSTDASVYRKKPLGVVFPKGSIDLAKIVRFAKENGIGLIPRSGGTSLAGQCVGSGLVVDVSRYMDRILEINKEEGWALVEAGVIRDDLNRHAAELGMFFGPNTSTANRCTLGGMLGNNSCGTTSIKYGTTRDKILEVHAILDDGSEYTFKDSQEVPPEGGVRGDEIVRAVTEALNPKEVRDEIQKHYPKTTIHRRNTGYAVDILAQGQPFNESGNPLNLGKLLAGSEGTLCFTSKLKLKLDPLPPSSVSVVCVHFQSISEAMLGTVEIMKVEPYACELMDKAILDLTEGNPEQKENRFFVEGSPGAIIAVELRADSLDLLSEQENRLQDLLKSKNLGYHFSIVRDEKINSVWTLRAAGLGVLSNVPGDAKPVAFVEDTAVDLEDLPAYIDAFQELMSTNDQEAIYYAHAGAGELHLRPILNLKVKKDRIAFRKIAKESAELVKKFKGSLSGEHGDGRVRAEFIELMIGVKNAELLREIKGIWDPQNIFNPGKIVNPDPVDTDFRYTEGQGDFTYPTVLRFKEGENMLQAAERCNGSGDCRKLEWTGATMCPSYQATRNEKDSTRARANVLREVLTNPTNPAYPLDSPEIKEVLDLCLSCKACKRECPSSVDMASLKAEATHHYQRRHGVDLRSQFFGDFHKYAKLASFGPRISNSLLKSKSISDRFKKTFKIASDRSIPEFNKSRASKALKGFRSKSKNPDFLLYLDEFTEFQDLAVAKAAATFFEKLGLKFHVKYLPSARASISKGLLNSAKETVNESLEELKYYIENQIPIVGLEPSAILGFKDEFSRLVDKDHIHQAEALAGLSFTFEEYVFTCVEEGRIHQGLFTEEVKDVHLHLHCHQKALSHVKYSKAILGLPRNYSVRSIPSGCCGMAGSFGYEEEHYDLSMEIGNLVLFPHIAKHPEALIVAAGTSCRHQIKDGTARTSFHPAEVLLAALK